jgi:hypothetical protein
LRRCWPGCFCTTSAPTVAGSGLVGCGQADRARAWASSRPGDRAARHRPDRPTLGQSPGLHGTKPDVQRASSAFLSIRLVRLCSRSAPVASPDPVQARLNVRFGPVKTVAAASAKVRKVCIAAD